MFQYSITSTAESSPLEQLRRAIAAEIGWIEISDTLSDEDLQLVEKECRERGIILTVVEDFATLRDKKYHGILVDGVNSLIARVREELGGHPIVGVKLRPGDDWRSLRAADIDYITIDVDSYNQKQIADYLKEISSVWNIPLVARTESAERAVIDNALATGFKGVCFLNPEALENI